MRKPWGTYKFRLPPLPPPQPLATLRPPLSTTKLPINRPVHEMAALENAAELPPKIAAPAMLWSCLALEMAALLSHLMLELAPSAVGPVASKWLLQCCWAARRWKLLLRCCCLKLDIAASPQPLSGRNDRTGAAESLDARNGRWWAPTI